MRTILETLADYAPMTKEPEFLTEFVRQNLGPQITSGLKADDGNLYVLTVDPETEMKVKEGFKEGATVSPSFVKTFLGSLDNNAEHFGIIGTNPIILTGPDTRRFVKRMIERTMPSVSVISTTEASSVNLQTLGVIGG